MYESSVRKALIRFSGQQKFPIRLFVRAVSLDTQLSVTRGKYQNCSWCDEKVEATIEERASEEVSAPGILTQRRRILDLWTVSERTMFTGHFVTYTHESHVLTNHTAAAQYAADCRLRTHWESCDITTICRGRDGERRRVVWRKMSGVRGQTGQTGWRPQKGNSSSNNHRLLLGSAKEHL